MVVGEGTLAGMSWAGQCERGTRRGVWTDGCAVGDVEVADGEDEAGHCNTANEGSCLERNASFVVLGAGAWSWSYYRPEVRCRDLKLPGSASVASYDGGAPCRSPPHDSINHLHLTSTQSILTNHHHGLHRRRSPQLHAARPSEALRFRNAPNHD